MRALRVTGSRVGQRIGEEVKHNIVPGNVAVNPIHGRPPVPVYGLLRNEALPDPECPRVVRIQTLNGFGGLSVVPVQFGPGNVRALGTRLHAGSKGGGELGMVPGESDVGQLLGTLAPRPLGQGEG